MLNNQALTRFTVDRDMSTVMTHLEKAASILGVDIPEIKVVPYMYNAFGQTIIAAEYNPAIDYQFYNAGRNFRPEQDLIIVADNYPAHDLCVQRGLLNEETAKLFPSKTTDSMVLFTLLHEIRHSWQHAKRRKEYYSQPNALTAYEHLIDPSEVDADAFALTFIKKYLHRIEPCLDCMIEPYFEKDGGLRKARCKKLRKSFIN